MEAPERETRRTGVVRVTSNLGCHVPSYVDIFDVHMCMTYIYRERERDRQRRMIEGGWVECGGLGLWDFLT